MKLAEALAERADIKARLQQLTDRATNSARVQEGDKPEEDPNEISTEVERLLARMEEMIRRINATNSSTPFDDSMTITDAIAKRDIAARRQRYYTSLANAAAERYDRFSRTEVRFVSAVNVSAVRSKADAAAKELRELDPRLQELNWNVELN